MIVGIAGPIASGKSALGRALAQHFSAKLISFGEYVRDQARARGIDTSNRRALQDLGQSLVAGNVQSFVERVFDWTDFHVGHHVILDGVRHSVVWNEVVNFAALHRETAKLIFLEMAEEDRQRRLAARGISRDEAASQDNHASEMDVPHRLRAEADLRVDALQDEAAMVATVRRVLGID